MDLLYLKEKELQKQEMETFAEFCQKEKSYQIRNDKKRDLQLRCEVRKIDTLESIGFPVFKIICQN